MSRTLRIAVASKGRLAEETIHLLARAGIPVEMPGDRRLFAMALGGRIQVLFVRAADIPEYVAAGSVHAGITGNDVIEESQAVVERRLDLGFGVCRLVLAVPNEKPWKSVADIPNGSRIATTFPFLTRRYFHNHGKPVRIVAVSGACEVTPMLGVADAITDLTQTGSTLASNHLREIDVLYRSSAQLICAPKVEAAVQDELERLHFALASVLDARGKRYLMADLPRTALPEVATFLPGVAGPTIVDIQGHPELVAIQVVIDEPDVYDAVHRLRRLGATGILVMPIDRMVP